MEGEETIVIVTALRGRQCLYPILRTAEYRTRVCSNYHRRSLDREGGSEFDVRARG